MKRTPLLLTALTLTFAACQPEAGGDLDKIKAERDSLKAEKKEISAKISELETQITALDTNNGARVHVVTTENLESTTFRHFFEVQGNVETDQNALIYPEVQGKIMKVATREGARVRKGDVLIRVDSRVVQNQIDETKSRLDLAEVVYKKQKSLWDQEIGSEIQYLEAKNNYDATKQRMEALQAQLAMYSIKAPFNGVVDEIHSKEGELASPMAPLVRVVNLDDVYMKCDISEGYLGKIKKGDKVNINFPSLNSSAESEIERIGKFINPQNRSFVIRLDIPNRDNMMLPNLLGEVKIMDFSQDSAIVVPVSLVQQLPNGEEYVYVADRKGAMSYAERRVIKTGMSYEGNILIQEGLSLEDEIIVDGSRGLKDGQLVQISE